MRPVLRCAFARRGLVGIIGGVNRFLLGFGLSAALALAAPTPPPPPPSSPAPAARERVLGVVQPEIRLNNGTVFKNAKVLGASLERGTATLSDSQRIRTVPLTQLPSPLREQVQAEAGRADRPRYNVYREEVRPTPPPDKVITPPPPEPVTPTITDRLIAQATAETPDELKLHLMRTNPQVSSLTTKLRKVEQVPGWPRIRASGDAAFAVWDNSRRDYVWRTEKFEVEFAIVNGTTLKLDRVMFGGISRQMPID